LEARRKRGGRKKGPLEADQIDLLHPSLRPRPAFGQAEQGAKILLWKAAQHRPL
jgi:hypothetical protein